MKKLKLSFSEVEVQMFQERKPKGLWMTEYLVARVLEAEGLLPAGFWNWKNQRQVKHLGMRNGKGRPGGTVQGTPIQILASMGTATNRQIAEASGVGYPQTRRRLWRDENAEWDGDLKIWRYRG